MPQRSDFWQKEMVQLLRCVNARYPASVEKTSLFEYYHTACLEPGTADDPALTGEQHNTGLDFLRERHALNQSHIKLLIFLYICTTESKLAVFFASRPSDCSAVLCEWAGMDASALEQALSAGDVLAKKGLLGFDEKGIRPAPWSRGIELPEIVMDFIADPLSPRLPACTRLADPVCDTGADAYAVDAVQRDMLTACFSQNKKCTVLVHGPEDCGKTCLVLSSVIEAGARAVFLVRDNHDFGRSTETLSKVFALTDPVKDVLIIDNAGDLIPNACLRNIVSLYLQDELFSLIERSEHRLVLIFSGGFKLSSSLFGRVDLALECRLLNSRKRAQVWDRLDAQRDLFSFDVRARLASQFTCGPGQIRKVYELCRSLSDSGVKGEALVRCAETALRTNEVLITAGEEGDRRRKADISLDLVHSSIPAVSIKRMIERWHLERGGDREDQREGFTVLLYGLPGTGKSAFARCIAGELGLPCIVKKSSDLISPYVGETEQAIRDVFKEAEESVLIIDEVDTFLFERSQAVRSWEVSQVNEFLQQLENFSGLFFGTTNNDTGLDDAVFRRFCLKVEFLPATLEQRSKLFEFFFPEHELRRQDLVRLQSLPVLVPGDFAVAARQARYADSVDATCLLDMLERETQGRVSPYVGFKGAAG